MSELKNDRLIRALLRQKVDQTPIWVMRQAGRYLPEYRQIREKAGSFMNLCQSPELACEVTLQPLERYPLDAAILFSDILTIPDAMGLGLYFTEGEGPKFKNPIRTEKDIDALAIPDPEVELRYVMDAVRLIRSELAGRVPLIGFAGSPWTIATYMVEGGGTKFFANTKTLMFDRPELMHRLLDKLAIATTEYLKAQIAAGAQAIMLFDTWGGMLTRRDYHEFSLAYMKKIVGQLKSVAPNVPITLFTKGGALWLESMADSGCDALGLDWTINIADARKRVGNSVALQGNMDPCVLYANPNRIEEEVKLILADYGKGCGHIFNLGHGIHPTIDPDHMGHLIESVQTHSRQYHQ